VEELLEEGNALEAEAIQSSTTKPVLVTLFRFAENFFSLAGDFLEAAFVLLGCLFAVVRLEGALFRAIFLFGVVFLANFFGVVRFFLFGMRGSLQLSEGLT
jgi:hypothetical protein